AGTEFAMARSRRSSSELAAGTSRSPALHVRQSSKSGIAVVPMVSPYVYLGGRLKLKAVGRSNEDRLTVSISTNNGRSFTELSSVPIAKPEDLTIDLKAKIPRRYAYWIKIELTEQAGLDAFEIEDDIQHAPRTLPWLGKSCLDRDLQRSRICGQNHLVGKQVHVLTACSNQGAEAMTRIHGVIAAGLLTLAGGIGISVGRAQQDQGAAEKVGSKLDEAGRSIKKGLEEARDAIREQFAR